MSLKRLIERTKGIDIQDVREDGNYHKPFKNLQYNLPQYQDPNPTENHAKNPLKIANLPTIEPKKLAIFDHYKKAFLQEKRRLGVFHPSEVSSDATPCMRKMYFDYAQVPVDVTFVKFTADNRMQRLVDLGTLVHLYVQYSLYQQGILEDFECDVVDEARGIAGSMDGAVSFYGEDDLGKVYQPEKMALEIKTINDFGFRALRYPKVEHIRQASIYATILKYKRICFVYYNKNTSELKIYVVDVDSDYVNNFFSFAESVIALYNKNTRICRTSDVSMHTELPSKVCQNRTSPRAKDCKFADFCFKHKC